MFFISYVYIEYSFKLQNLYLYKSEHFQHTLGSVNMTLLIYA